MSGRQSAHERWKPSIALVVSMLALWAVAAALYVKCVALNGGRFAYTLDDAYIHLSFAKNLALHGVFGVTSSEFASAESSLLWGLILAAVALVLRGEALTYAPLILNLGFASALLVVVQRIYTGGSQPASSSQRAALRFGEALLLLAVLFVTPLPWLIFSGMEHVLQALLTIAFLYLASLRLSASPKSSWNGQDPVLMLLGSLVTTVRYEGLFPVACVCLLFLVRRRFLMAFLLGAAGVLPLVVFGLISVQHGWFLLPNSVVLKSRFGDAASKAMISRMPQPLALFQLLERSYMLVLVFACIALSAVRLSHYRAKLGEAFWHPATLLPLVFIAVTVLNLQSALLPTTTAASIWYIRYDAYLVTLGLLATAVLAREVIADQAIRMAGAKLPSSPLLRPALVLIALLAIAACWDRGTDTLQKTPAASNNIYSQQLQMGAFVNRFYAGDVVAVNDIGAVNYFADIRCVDLFGLATIEIARLKMNGTFNSETIRSLNQRRGAKIAIAYDHWFKYAGGLPKEWVKVGEWKIPGNVVCGGDTVIFYAVDAAEQARLTENLKTFSPALPRGVVQTISSDLTAAAP